MKGQLAPVPAGIIMACALVDAFAAGSAESLSVARALWAKTAPTSYSYVVRELTNRLTVCRGPDGRNFSLNEATITVGNGHITRIAAEARVPPKNGRAGRWSSVQDVEIPVNCLESMWLYKQNLHTIEGLFAFIDREQVKRNGIPNPETQYDPTYGFPRYVEEEDMLDGSSYTIEKFKVLK